MNVYQELTCRLYQVIRSVSVTKSTMTDLLLHLDVGDQTVPEMVWWYCRINVRNCIQLATGRVTYIIIAAGMTWIKLAQRTLRVIPYQEVPMELFMKLHVKGKISFRRGYIKEKKIPVCLTKKHDVVQSATSRDKMCDAVCASRDSHDTASKTDFQWGTTELPDHVDNTGTKYIAKK